MKKDELANRSFYDDLGHMCYKQSLKSKKENFNIFECEYEDGLNQKSQLEPILVKQIELRNLLPHHSAYIDQEIQIMTFCKDQNIVQYKFHLKTKNYMYIGMEYTDLSTSELVKNFFGGRLPEHLVIIWMQQMANAFSALHSMHIIHRNLKIENVRLKLTESQKTDLLHGKLDFLPNALFKLMDMGFAKILQEGDLTETLCGTAEYMAPEVGLSQEYGIEADMFSLGVCVYELLFGCTPFTTMQSIMDQQIKFDFPQVKVSPQMRQLVQSMLKFDVKERLKWSDFYKHPIIKVSEKEESISKQRIEAYVAVEQNQTKENENQYMFVGVQAMIQNINQRVKQQQSQQQVQSKAPKPKIKLIPE